jgi:hypothetical protein
MVVGSLLSLTGPILWRDRNAARYPALISSIAVALINLLGLVWLFTSKTLIRCSLEKSPGRTVGLRRPSYRPQATTRRDRASLHFLPSLPRSGLDVNNLLRHHM